MNIHCASMVDNDSNLVYTIPDSTVKIIQRAIEGIQKMIRPYESKEGETPPVTVAQINPAMKRHFELECLLRIPIGAYASKRKKACLQLQESTWGQAVMQRISNIFLRKS